MPQLTFLRAATYTKSVGAPAPSIASMRRFVSIPPCAEKPPNPPSAASTRWQGTTIGNGLRAERAPTAWAAPRSPIRAAISP